MRNYKAFTLVELMVVISIISIMTAVTITSFNASRHEASLNAARREVASAIKLAQSYALQGRVQDFSFCGGPSPRTPQWYGLTFPDATHYQITYGDQTGPCAGSSRPVESHELKNEVRSQTLADIVQIYVPNAEVGCCLPLPDNDLTLNFNSGSMTKSITINGQLLITEN